MSGNLPISLVPKDKPAACGHGGQGDSDGLTYSDGSTYSDYPKLSALHQMDIAKFLDSDCDYYFFISSDAIITNANIIKELLELNKDVVAPLLRRGSDLWTNFWGDLDTSGFYNRSFDYIDVINLSKKGCWNVPYITNAYLIKREIIEKLPTIFTDNEQTDVDMRLCLNFRLNDIFMYVTNLKPHGYLAHEEPAKPAVVVPTLTNELTLYDLFSRKLEWEEKYLHPLYLEFENSPCSNTSASLGYNELCPDIYNFPLFSEAFCTELILRMETYGKWSKGKDGHDDRV